MGSALGPSHPPANPAQDPGAPGSYLSLGPCKQRRRGPQTPPSPCSQAQRAVCGLSTPSYPPVRRRLRRVAQELRVEMGRARGGKGHTSMSEMAELRVQDQLTRRVLR